MTGNKGALINLRPTNLENVKFGDGVKEKFLAVETLKVPRISRLEIFCQLKGLKANLISISQL